MSLKSSECRPAIRYTKYISRPLSILITLVVPIVWTISFVVAQIAKKKAGWISVTCAATTLSGALMIKVGAIQLVLMISPGQ